MVAGQKQFWRVVNASADGYYDVSLDNGTIHVVSIDGVPLAAYPGGQEQDVHDFVIPPPGRAEFVVAGPSSGGSGFRTTCFDTGPDGDPNPSQVLAPIDDATPGLPTVLAPGATPPSTGTYEQPIGSAFAQQRTVTFTENDSGFFLNAQQ